MKSWRWMCVYFSVTIMGGVIGLGCSVESGTGDPVCGNGKVEEGEQCDQGDLASHSCVSLGYDEGDLGCEANCVFILSGCRGGNPCGNGIVDLGEDCDGGELNGATCLNLDWGFNGGTLGCSEECQYDTAACVTEVCGDGTIGPGEDCESTDLGGATCESLNYGEGTLLCNEWACIYDLSGCTGDPCGNGIVDYAEECDGMDLNAETCESQGFAGGLLACSEDCWFDWSQCISWCGNGTIDGNLDEECDGGNLNGMACTDLGFDGGVLACDDFWCEFDTFDCTGDPCGNGVLDHGESCDGTDLGGETCESQGYQGGVLACGEYCYFDTWACESLCGNGVVDVDEWEECDGANLDGKTCESAGFIGGMLACSEYCGFDYSMCETACGNGAIDPNEACDGTNLNGQTCQGLGYDGGTLGCNSYCEFDSRNCTCPGDDQYEPNGTSASAAQVQQTFNSSGLIMCGTGDEDWFQVALNAKTIYAFDVTFSNAEGDLDAYLYRVSDPDTAQTSGVSTTDNENLTYGVSTANAGSYYLQIVRYSSPVDSQSYSLTISAQQQVGCVDSSDCSPGLVCSGYQCGQPAQGDVCLDPIIITSLPFSVTGVDIAQFGSDFTFGDSNCTGWAVDGRDVFYRVDLTAGQSISVSVTSDFDAALYLISDCSASACLIGTDAAVSNGTETIEYTATAGGPVYIGIDHYLPGGPASGTFDLSVSLY